MDKANKKITIIRINELRILHLIGRIKPRTTETAKKPNRFKANNEKWIKREKTKVI